MRVVDFWKVVVGGDKERLVDCAPNVRNLNQKFRVGGRIDSVLGHLLSTGHPDVEAVDLLFNHGVRIDRTLIKSHCLFRAIEQHETGLLKILLDNGAEPDCLDENGCTPLIVAACFRDHVSTQLLLAKNADTNIGDNEGNTALSNATSCYCFTAASLLARHGVDMECNANACALVWACAMVGFKTAFLFAEMLLKNGADPNKVVSDDNEVFNDRSALFYCTENGFESDMVHLTELMLQNGGDPWRRTPLGMPFMHAFMEENISLLFLFLRYSGDILSDPAHLLDALNGGRPRATPGPRKGSVSLSSGVSNARR